MSLRKQEIGVRMALGASASSLQRRFFIRTLRLGAAGMALGLMASWILAQSMHGLLFGVTPSEPVTFVATFAVLMAAAGLAGYLPARRASRLDPVDALRAN